MNIFFGGHIQALQVPFPSSIVFWCSKPQACTHAAILCRTFIQRKKASLLETDAPTRPEDCILGPFMQRRSPLVSASFRKSFKEGWNHSIVGAKSQGEVDSPPMKSYHSESAKADFYSQALQTSHAVFIIWPFGCTHPPPCPTLSAHTQPIS